MTLPLDIIHTSGRAAIPVEVELIRPLMAADLAALDAPRNTSPSPIKRLRERHHALARNIASGMKHTDAAAICGYDISRVSILMGDPTFKELVAFYAEDVNKQYAQLHETLSGLAMDAALVLRERLEDEPEKVSTDKLTEIVKMAADRTGHGPTMRQELNVNVGISARLAEARKRIAERTIDLQVNKDE